jgi:feruloyl esterase
MKFILKQNMLILGVLQTLFISPHLQATGCNQLIGAMPAPSGASSLTITSARVVSANDANEPLGVDHCKVEGIIDVVPSDIGRTTFLMRMPLTNWNGKLLQTGTVGFGVDPSVVEGSFLTANIYNLWPNTSALTRGYAILSEDGGHQPNHENEFSLSWALDPSGHVGQIDNEREIDFFGRSIHLSKLASQTILQSFYGQNAKKSYYIGCSTSGYNGWNVMRNYPDDFNGMILEGSYYGPSQLYTEIWHQKIIRGLETNFTQQQLQLISNKVIAKCDALDGVVDGMLSDHKKCTNDYFDPLVDLPKCTNVIQTNCFTVKQILALKALYYGPIIYSGTHGLIPSSEAPPSAIGAIDLQGSSPTFLIGWDQWITGGNWPINGESGLKSYEMVEADQYAKYILFDNPNFNAFNYVDNKPLDDIYVDIMKNFGAYNMLNDTLVAYKNKGGKVMIMQGLLDPIDWAGPTIGLYEKIADINGGFGNTNKFARLFLKPGVGHCFDGTGPILSDTLSALENWVENNKAPEAITAYTMEALTSGQLKSRPLCSYPKVAKIINPNGNIWDANNFECK